MNLISNLPAALLTAGAVLLPFSAPSMGGAAIGAPPAAVFGPNVRADAGEGNTKGGQSEPQVAVDETGETYVTWQGSTSGDTSGVGIARTRDGVSFQALGTPDKGHMGVGDVALATSTWFSSSIAQSSPVAGSNGLFFSELGQTACGPINIRGATSADGGRTWDDEDATCQPLQTDRNWVAAYTPAQYRGTSDAIAHTVVYQEYHDFGAYNVWVSVSTDGGHSWGTLQQDAIQAGTPAQETSACNSIVGGIAVDQRGAHAGRVYAVWMTSDLASNLAEGCNDTQAQPFDHIFISYSDDEGQTWTSHTVYNDPCAPTPPAPPVDPTQCQDISMLFTPLAVDDAGNVYVAFPWYHASSESAEYDIGMEVSTDGGDTWNGGTADSPGAPFQVNSDTGTHYEPWIAAGAAGAVDVAYYRTPYVEAPATLNKPGAAPADALWNTFMSQSLDATAGHNFTESQVSTHAVAFGGICTVGTFCNGALSSLGWATDRTLYDDFGVAIGPDGGARIAWTDTRDSWSSSCTPGTVTPPTATKSCQSALRHVYFACQTGGAGLHGETVTGCGTSATATARPACADGPNCFDVKAMNRTRLPNTGAAFFPSPAAPLLLVLPGAFVLRRRRQRMPR